MIQHVAPFTVRTDHFQMRNVEGGISAAVTSHSGQVRHNMSSPEHHLDCHACPMSLELVPDDGDNWTHALMDNDVLKVFGQSDWEPSNLCQATFLLITIVSASKETLNSMYKDVMNARALLENHPPLIDMLKGA
jgi:hypothetical protein